MCAGGKGQSTTGLAQISKTHGLVTATRNHTKSAFIGAQCTEDSPILSEWSANRTQKTAISSVARSQFVIHGCAKSLFAAKVLFLGLGNDLRVRCLLFSVEFVYLSLAAKIEPEGCFGSWNQPGCLMAF